MGFESGPTAFPSTSIYPYSPIHHNPHKHKPDNFVFSFKEKYIFVIEYLYNSGVFWITWIIWEILSSST